jgi:hypothetical protein
VTVCVLNAAGKVMRTVARPGAAADAGLVSWTTVADDFQEIC